MCKLNNIKNTNFIVYYLTNENYVGVTQNLKNRLIKHKSKSNFDINNVEILYETSDLNKAFEIEIYYQNLYKCKLGVRNQYGEKNPYAKQVLHLKTGIFFDTIKDACKSLNFNYSSVRKLISDNNNKYNLIRI
jgi:predicted GIY-YIG superfamily endonuclease